MRDIGGIEVKGNDTIIWTNSEMLSEELQMRYRDGGDDRATERALNRGIVNQIRKRSWEEDDKSWIAHLGWNGQYKYEVYIWRSVGYRRSESSKARGDKGVGEA